MEEVYFSEDGVYRYVTMYTDNGISAYRAELIMTKDVFVECYKHWIEGAQEENK